MKAGDTQPVRYLSDGDMERIHRTALHVSEKIGMKVDHTGALEYLGNAGCDVDMDSRLVLFPEDVDYIGRIGEVVAGGREAHRKNPVLVGYAEARSPLCIDTVMADVMIAHLERGLPQSLDTIPNAGATSPPATATCGRCCSDTPAQRGFPC